MKIKTKLLLAITPLLLITGCSMNEPTIPQQDKREFIQYDNTSHIFGTKESAIKTVSYIEEEDNKIVTKITFNIDKFPYTLNFNLCKDIKRNPTISEKRPAHCNSSISIKKDFQGNLIGNYNLNMLKGYNIKYHKGNKLYLATTQQNTTNYTFFTDSSEINSLYRTSKRSYWEIK